MMRTRTFLSLGAALALAGCGPQTAEPYYYGRVLGPFAAPTEVKVEGKSLTELEVSWNDPSDGWARYRIERSLTSEEPWEKLADLEKKTVSYLDSGLEPETTYHYRLTALSYEGNSEPSAYAAGTTLAPPDLTPAPPTDVTVRSVSTSALEVRWGPATDRGGGIASYQVFLNGVVVAVTNELTHSDGNLATGVQYCYSVSGVDTTGRVGVRSADACGKPGEVPTQPGAPTVSYTGPSATTQLFAPATFMLTATAADDGQVTRVEFLQGASVLGADTTAPYQLTWTGVAAGSYAVRVRATDDLGNQTSTAPVNLTVGAGFGDAVTGFTLFNADNNQPIAGFDPIPDGATLSLAALPTQNLGIVANTNPAVTGSVRFGWEGNAMFRVESAVPYSIFGDANGVVTGGVIAVGQKELVGTTFSMGAAGGTAGGTRILKFTVAP